MSSFITLSVYFSFGKDLYFQPVGKRVYYGRAYSVKPAGNFISPASEFSAGMENGKYYFNGRNTRFMIDADRNPSSVIYDCNGIIFIDGNVDRITKTCQRFVNGIIYNLIHKMMQSPQRGTSNIHTRPFSYRF